MMENSDAGVDGRIFCRSALGADIFLLSTVAMIVLFSAQPFFCEHDNSWIAALSLVKYWMNV